MIDISLINNIYVFVDNEDISRSTNVPQHPVEKGLPLTDNVRHEPKELSISGKIVNTDSRTAESIIAEIEKLRTSGSLISYSGRNVVGNYMIRSFNTSHPNTNWGGADFNMELVEVRIAQSAYDESKQKKAEAVNNPSLTVGSIVVFKGGSVYVSSDATKASANRGRQTCKITKISTKSWSIHQYHLISIDKQYPNNVYGWVDKSNIEGTGATATVTSGTTNAGKKQTTTTKTTQTANITSIRLGDLSKSIKADIYKGYITYVTVGGETLKTIAQQFANRGSTVAKIKQWNNLSYTDLFPLPKGKTLKVAQDTKITTKATATIQTQQSATTIRNATTTSGTAGKW